MQTSIQDIVARNIRFARENGNLTQEQVAKILGLSSHSAVSDIEAGKRRVSVNDLDKLGMALGRSLNWFLDKASSEEDFILLTRAQKNSEAVRKALQQAQRFCENYIFLKKVLSVSGRH